MNSAEGVKCDKYHKHGQVWDTMAVQVHYWSKCCRRCPRSFCSDATNRENKHSCLKTERHEEINQTLKKVFGVHWHHPPIPNWPNPPSSISACAEAWTRPGAVLAPGPAGRAGLARGWRSCSAATKQLSRSARSQACAFRKAHAGLALQGGNLVLVLPGGLCRHPELSQTTQQGPSSRPLWLKGTEHCLSASSPQDTRLEGEGRWTSAQENTARNSSLPRKAPKQKNIIFRMGNAKLLLYIVIMPARSEIEAASVFPTKLCNSMVFVFCDKRKK